MAGEWGCTGTPALDEGEREATLEALAGGRGCRHPLRMRSPQGRWEFDGDLGDSLTSSQRKTVYRGRYRDLRRLHPAAIDACAVIFPEGYLDFFGNECEALGRANGLGIGPAKFATARCVRTVPDAVTGEPVREPGAVIIEEDVGVSLERVLHGGEPIPGPRPMGLHDPAREPGLRAREGAKIIFDVACQLKVLHDHDLQHRDLRTANVCVRRHGEDPRDLRATLVDFELNADRSTAELGASAPDYYRAIFKRDAADGAAGPVSPLELDLGYLAALCYEVETGRAVYEARPLDPRFHRGEDYGFFWLSERDGSVHVLRLTQADLDGFARAAGLEPIDEGAMARIVELDPAIPAALRRQVLARLARYARRHVVHGGYLDAKDVADLRRDPGFIVTCHLPELAQSEFERHNQLLRDDGKEPPYGSFLGQPDALIAEGLDSIEADLEWVGQLGFRLVLESERRIGERPLPQFESREIEAAAKREHESWLERKRRDGYRLGPRCEEPGHLRNPNMKPYEELDELERRKNVEIVKRIVENLGRLGILVVR